MQGKGLGQFTDIDKLTMFADYRVPAALRDFGILEYSRELAQQAWTNLAVCMALYMLKLALVNDGNTQ